MLLKRALSPTTMLTQLATVKARLSILPGDTSQDDLLTRVIQGVSARFDRETGRVLARTVGATHEFPASEKEILPPSYPIEAVTKFEVKENEAGGWVEQTGVDYLIRRTCVISLSAELSPLSSQLGRVTYSGGYVLPGTTPGAGQTALPADLENAATEQVAAWSYNRDKLGLIRHWPSSGTYVVLSQMPLLSWVAATLRRYQRWVV